MARSKKGEEFVPVMTPGQRPSWSAWAPPREIILMARAVLGAVDLDPYSLPIINRAVMAKRFYDRSTMSLDSICAKEWSAPGDKRAFIAAPGTAAETRRLLNKTLREYRAGHISQAVIWIAHNENLTRCPWIWDYPVCIPFRRLKPLYWDDDWGEFLDVVPSDWSAVVYLPPPDTAADFHAHMSRFQVSFSAFGRVVFNQFSGEADWEDAYAVYMKRTYNYRD
jgi:hypothetical protein